MTITDIQNAIDSKVDDPRQLINMIADYLQANPGGGQSYLVYTFLATQSASNAPIPTILQNTIGNIVWTRNSQGYYIGTLAGAFTVGKTMIITTNTGDGARAYNQFTAGVIDANSIFLESASFNSGTGNWDDSDDTLFGTPIEIRVYP